MKLLLPAVLLAATALGLASARPANHAAPSATAPGARSGAVEYHVDATHSSVLFRTKHLGVAWFYGRFNRVEGVVHFDEANPAGSSVEIVIPAESVDTNSGSRDEHLRSPDFLGVKEFPEITFTSTSVEKVGERYRVTGELTFRGTTKSVTAEVEHVGTAAGRQGTKAGFEAILEIDPREYGVTWMTQREGAVGPIVRLIVSLECDQA